MPKIAREQIFNGSLETSAVYDSTKITLAGSLVKQRTEVGNPSNKYLGVAPVSAIRAQELSGWNPGSMHIIRYGNKHILFSADGATGATRRVAAFTYDLLTEAISYLGFITLTFPTGITQIIRGVRASIQPYTAGTVGVEGAIVTGVGTSWTTDRMCAGSRIGFGTTDAHQVVTWYEILSVDNNGQITLTAPAGSIPAGTSYVLEDFKLVVSTTSTTVTAGGLNVVKGIRLDGFGAGGITVLGATNIDNVRAVYRLKDAAPITNQQSDAVTYYKFVNWQTEWIIVPDGNASNLKLYMYNIRAPLTHVAGDGALLTAVTECVTTGIQVVTGTLMTYNNGRIVTANHGPGLGVESLYLATTTRIIRIPVAAILQGSTAFIEDQMIEVPLGGASGLPATGALNSPEYSASLDRFIFSGFTAPGGRIYVTPYRSDGGQFENHFGMISSSYDQSIANNPLFPKLFAAAQLWSEDGILYWTIFGGVVSTTGVIYIFPGFGAHWDYAATTGERAILPAMNLGSSPTRFNRVLGVANTHIETLPGLVKVVEPYRILYRTAGIADNSGAWTIAPQDGDLSGLAPAPQIQFAIEWLTMGDVCVVAQVKSICLIYETEDALPDTFQWNFGDSNVVDGTFGFTQTDALTSWPAVFTIKMYRADTDSLILEQSSDGTLLGVFEYWDGNAWVVGLGTNTANIRRRFVPSSSLPGGVDLYATLQVT